VLAYCMGVFVRAHRVAERPLSTAIDPRRLSTLATVASVIGVALFVAGVSQQGVSVFADAYGDFFDVHNMFSWGVLLVGYAGVLLIASHGRIRSLLLWVVLLYGPLAAILFAAGARSAPVATAVTLVIVAEKRGLRVPTALVITCAVVLLAAVSIVRESRSVGIGGIIRGEATVDTFGPVQGLTEMGASLRPVVATIDHVENRGFYWGATYAYPLVRQVQQILRVRRSSEFETPYFIASNINQEYGSIGYSSIAEAYANGGIVGVVVVGLIFGFVVTWLDLRCRTAFDVAVLGATLIPLIMMVRNSFVFVPGWLELGLIPIFIIRKFAPRKSMLPDTGLRRASRGTEASREMDERGEVIRRPVGRSIEV
jgi:oligosaccharide repeat unit polymerase